MTPMWIWIVCAGPAQATRRSATRQEFIPGTRTPHKPLLLNRPSCAYVLFSRSRDGGGRERSARTTDEQSVRYSAGLPGPVDSGLAFSTSSMFGNLNWESANNPALLFPMDRVNQGESLALLNYHLTSRLMCCDQCRCSV